MNFMQFDQAEELTLNETYFPSNPTPDICGAVSSVACGLLSLPPLSAGALGRLLCSGPALELH